MRDDTITTLNCDKCGRIVGFQGHMAIGCAKHPSSDYSPGGTYVAVDALLSDEALKAALDVDHGIDPGLDLLDEDADHMRRTIRAAVDAVRAAKEPCPTPKHARAWCPACEQTVRGKPGDEVPCHSAEGSLSAPPPIVTLTKEPCPTCEGTGQADEELFYLEGFSATVPVGCPSCGGDGLARGER